MVDTSKFTILDGGTKYIAVKTLAKCTILGPDSALQNLKINVTGKNMINILNFNNYNFDILFQFFSIAISFHLFFFCSIICLFFDIL